MLNYSYFIPTFHQIPFFPTFFLKLPTFFLLFNKRPLSSLQKVDFNETWYVESGTPANYSLNK